MKHVSSKRENQKIRGQGPDSGLLSHELVHAASLVFDDRKMRYWVAYSEMLAYYVGYLTKEFLEKLFKDAPE